MQTKRSNRGFTLIELLIVIAIVAILTAIAMPSYNSQMRKSRRADAQAVLMNIASRQQQMLLDTRTYVGTTDALRVTVPTSVSSKYTVAIELGAGTQPTFKATATPTGDQAKDSCGALSIDQTGAKLADNVVKANCW